MDPFTIATGVAGLVSLSFQLIKIATGYPKATAGIQDFLDELRGLSNILQQLADFLTAKAGSISFTNTSTLYLSSTSCTTRLQNLLRKFEKRSSLSGKAARVISRLRWPLEEKEHRQLIEDLHRYSQIFKFALNVEQCELLSKTSNEVAAILDHQIEILAETEKVCSAMPDLIAHTKEASDMAQEMVVALDILVDKSHDIDKISQGVKHLEIYANEQVSRQLQEDDEAQRQELLEWLSPLTFAEKQREILERHQPGTGAWLLHHEKFQCWINEDKEPLLWCSGIPGAGKTVMASLVVEHLKQNPQTTSNAVAFIFCDYKDQSQQKILNLISSITRQFASQADSSMEMLKTLCLERGPKSSCDRGKSLTLSEHCDLLRSLSKDIPRGLIVVDAIDELPETNDHGEDARDYVLQVLKELSPFYRILITSRPHIEPGETFDSYTTITIEATEEDLATYLHSKLSSSKRLKKFIAKDKKLREDIIAGLTKKACGMFLLAKLQLTQVISALTARQAREILDQLTHNLTDVFEDTIKRIKKQSIQESTLGMRVLAWIACSTRPLLVKELVHALSVESGDTSLDPDGLLDISTILATTAGLVHLQANVKEKDDSVSEDNKTIRFVHYTVEEFLADNKLRMFPEADLDICHTCLTYLGFEDFKRKSSNLGLSTRVIFPFLVYAARYWVAHAAKVESGLDPELIENIVSPTAPHLCYNWLRIALYNTFQTLYREIPIGFSLAVACKEAALNVLQILIDAGVPVNVQLDSQWTPLKVAVRYDHPECISRLLEAGADVNHGYKDASDNNYVLPKSPLVHAVEKGTIQVIQQLLDKEAKFNGNPSALICAVNATKKPVVELLLKTGCDPNIDVDRETPLIKAAAGGLNEIITILLDAGANPNHLPWSGKSPLQSAIAKGQWASAIQLLDAGADPRLRSTPDRYKLYPGSGLLETIIDLWGKDTPTSLLSRLLDSGVNISGFKGACQMIQKIEELRDEGIWEASDPSIIRIENQIHNFFARSSVSPTDGAKFMIITGIPPTATKSDLSTAINNQVNVSHLRLFYTYSNGAFSGLAVGRFLDPVDQGPGTGYSNTIYFKGTEGWTKKSGNVQQIDFQGTEITVKLQESDKVAQSRLEALREARDGRRNSTDTKAPWADDSLSDSSDYNR